MEYQKLNTLTLSEQAKREIHKYIKNMDLSRNNKLPREEVMAEMIGVSRITIRQAFNDLASEGIIFRRQGKGTFVNVDSLNIKVKFNPCMEFTQMIENSGYTPSVRLLNFLADDTVCAFCRDYFSLSLIGGEEAFREFSKYENSIFQYIYNLSGEKIEWDKVEIDTILTTEIEGLDQYADMNQLGCKPFLYLKGINYSSSDRPLIHANEYINTAIIKFNMIRQKNIRY